MSVGQWESSARTTARSSSRSLTRRGSSLPDSPRPRGLASPLQASLRRSVAESARRRSPGASSAVRGAVATTAGPSAQRDHGRLSAAVRWLEARLYRSRRRPSVAAQRTHERKESPRRRQRAGRPPLTAWSQARHFRAKRLGNLPHPRSKHDSQTHDLPRGGGTDSARRAGRRCRRQRRDRIVGHTPKARHSPRSERLDRRSARYQARENPRQLTGAHPVPVQEGLGQEERVQDEHFAGAGPRSPSRNRRPAQAPEGPGARAQRSSQYPGYSDN